MERILIVNGPNLNLLGRREPEIYGVDTLADLDEQVRGWGMDLGVAIETFQSNHEGAIVDALHDADHDAIVLNAGALTHYSYVLHDAIEAISIPVVEVHISNVKAREPWRRRSVISAACVTAIYGRGRRGYRDALRHLVLSERWPATTISYGDDVPDQVGDLRVPAGTGPHPVVVVIHGGFWADVWQRDLMDAVAIDLAERGWATWNIEYRRVGTGGGWPGTQTDVAAAIDHVANLDDDLDLTRVVLLGHSAGGQLALWAAAREASPGVVRPTGVVALAPVTDLARAHRLGLDDGAVERLMRRSPDAEPGRYRASSPLALLPIGVPQVIVHGDRDDRVPVQMSRAYAGEAADAGDEVLYHEFEGTGHFEVIDPDHIVWSKIAAELEQLA